MANVSRTIDVIFNGVDSMSPAVRGVTTGLKKVNAAIDKTIEKVDLLADKFKTASAAAAILGTTLVGLALNEYRKYQDAWVDLVKITKDGEDALVGVQDTIRGFSRQYGEDTTEITKSMFEFKRSGLEVAEALTLTENAMRLTVAGNSTMEDSTMILKQVMAGFRVEAEDTGHIVDVLNVISDNYNTNVTQLGIALSRVSPAANKMNVTMDRTAALLTPIIEIFGSGEEASTAYRRGLLRLVSEEPKVVKTFKRLGIEQRIGPNKTLRDGNDILTDYIEALKDKTEAEQLSYLTLVFGERQASKLAESFSQFAKVTEIEAIASTVKMGNTTDQVNKKLATLDTAMRRVSVGIKEIGKSFGAELEPGASAALVGIESLIQGIAAAAREGLFEELFAVFTDLGTKLGDYFVGIGEALPDALKNIDYSGLIGAIQDFLGTVNDAFEGLDLTKPEDLAKAIQFVVDTMESGVHTAKGMLEIYDRVKDTILKLVDGYNKLDDSQKVTYGKLLATADVMEKTGKILGLITTYFERGDDFLRSMGIRGSGTFKLIGAEAKLFGAILNEIWLSTRSLVLKSLDFITAGASKMVNDALDDVAESQEKNEKKIHDAMVDIAKGYDQLVHGIDSVANMWDEAEGEAAKFNSTVAKTPKKVTVELTVEGDEGTIDPEVAKMAEKVNEALNKKKAEGHFKLSTDIEVAEDKDLTDFFQAKGKYAGREAGVFSDAALAKVEAQSIELKRDLQAAAEAGEEITDVELDVPDDEKFKAAQAKLLKEIETNASVIETQIQAVADVADSQAESISASFESVGESISSSGDVLTELYRQLATAQFGLAQSAIQRKITAEEERRQEAFDLQQKLTNAQIDLMKQRSAAMASGDPMVTVSGDGLQPHLEAFMWEILSAIQVRVNEDYGSFLLGIGA